MFLPGLTPTMSGRRRHPQPQPFRCRHRYTGLPEAEVAVAKPQLVGTVQTVQSLTGAQGHHIMLANMAKDPPTIANIPSIWAQPKDNQAVPSLCSGDTFLTTVFAGKKVREGALGFIHSLYPDGLGLDTPSAIFCHEQHLDHDFLDTIWPRNLDFTSFIHEGDVDYDC